MINIFLTFAVGIEAKFINFDFVDRWAEKIISQLDNAQPWLFELLLSKNEMNALEIFRNNIYKGMENSEISQFQSSRNRKYVELFLGFLYLSYKENKISYDELMSQAGEILDIYGLDHWSIETFVSVTSGIANIFEEDIPINRLFLSCAKCAQHEFLYLQSDECMHDNLLVLTCTQN